MNFRLSPETKKMLANNTTVNKRCKINPNSQEFYKKHPDLVPRNVYLASGRVMHLDDVDKYIKKMCKKPITERIGNWFSKIAKKIFKKGEK